MKVHKHLGTAGTGGDPPAVTEMDVRVAKALRPVVVWLVRIDTVGLPLRLHGIGAGILNDFVAGGRRRQGPSQRYACGRGKDRASVKWLMVFIVNSLLSLLRYQFHAAVLARPSSERWKPPGERAAALSDQPRGGNTVLCGQGRDDGVRRGAWRDPCSRASVPTPSVWPTTKSLSVGVCWRSLAIS